MNTTEQLSIDIRPDSGVYATFRRISYRPWSAIAEFIDNSTQNYFEHKQDIGKTTGTEPTLEIEIVHEPKAKTLAIIDNANGMNWDELERAIQLNRPPIDTCNGLPSQLSAPESKSSRPEREPSWAV